MKKTAVIILILSAAEIFSYPFTVPYFNEEFFLYPYLNYDQSLEWKKTKEGHLYEGGLVQTSHGSLTTWLLLSSEEAVINSCIGDDFTFRFRYRKYVNRHLSYDEHSTSAGLGYSLNENFTLMTEAELSSEKSEIDIKPGILFKFQTVYAYAGVNFNDFLFDIKNTGDGVSNSTPLTLSTDIRFSFSRLYFFISGNYGTGIDRTWPTGTYYKNVIRNMYFRAEYDINDRIKIYSENYIDFFYDEGGTEDSIQTADYEFSANLRTHRLGSVVGFGDKNIIDSGMAFAEIEHSSERRYKINYSVLMPYLTFKRKFTDKITAETSFMGSYNIGKENIDHNSDAGGRIFLDKELFKLGLEYRFSPNSSLYISAGQLINTGVFGGGNARFNLFF
ncbi:TPA: hypothetical protein DCR49_09325 [Candidatus Delongbacteria bacterium]|nr:hypothetical protein [Candidatus Delongbacteria bacterium]